jgi:hypothetical protein
MLFAALSQELERFDEQAYLLMAEAIPDAGDYDYPRDLLDSWERILALPDVCTTETQTDLERAQAVVAKLKGVGAPLPATFAEIAETLGYEGLARVLDNYRLIDNLANWTPAGIGTYTPDSAQDPDGGSLADVLVMPGIADGVDVDLLRIANYESVYFSFRARSATGDDVDLRIYCRGRDSVLKYTDVFTFGQQWQRYEFTVDDVGTGVADVKVELSLDSGTDRTVHLFEQEGGFRERYYEVFSAGSGAGIPVGGDGWKFAWAVEYGEDITDRSGSNPNWQKTGAITITLDDEDEQISRDQLADKFAVAGGGSISLGIDNPPSWIRYSFWAKSTTDTSVGLYINSSVHGATLIETLNLTSDWQKVEGVLELAAGGGSWNFAWGAWVPSTTTVYFAHFRTSQYDAKLECKIENQAPLHTVPIFGSYEELG